MTNQRKIPFVEPELSVEELTHALYKVNLQLSETNQQLTESEQKRLELYSNLSHDLRSPISSVKSYLEYLLAFDDLEKDEVFDIHSKMANKIQSIEHMINEMFLMTTLDNKPIDALNFKKVSVLSFLQELFSSYKSDPKYKNRILKFEIPEDFKYSILIDIPLFKRALDNLFTNALKYSNEGSQIILGAYTRMNTITITLKDTGIGISTDHLNHIFERSYRVTEERTPDSTMGCGLGLSIVQSIITQHGGKIWCESELNTGSTFSIAMPLI